MSRTRFSFRPQVEALEDRFAPVTLFGSPDLSADLALLAGIHANQQEATRTSASVVGVGGFSFDQAESTITRTDDSATLTLKASDVPAGAYTAWLAIFTPGSPTPIAGWAGGHVVGQGGKLNIAVHLNEGETLSGHPVFPSGSLQDARHQEIHLVIRYHGPVDPGRIYDQTHTFESAALANNVLVAVHPAQ